MDVFNNPFGRRATALCCLAFSAINTPVYALECGDVITTPSFLFKQLSCSESPALTVVGPATLSMNGFSVTCDSQEGGVGILLSGSDGFISGGEVSGCRQGVVVDGSGGHSVFGMTVSANGFGDDGEGDGDEAGFLVLSGYNFFIQNQALNNGVDGFNIDGSHNAFLYNKSSDNENDGFDIDGGSYNSFSNNTASGNGDDGFDVDSGFSDESDLGEGEHNTFTLNMANGNGRDGFDVDGNYGRFINNTANNNGMEDDENEEDGFDIDSKGNVLRGNIANNNPGDGIVLKDNDYDEGDNTLESNSTRRNGQMGIRVISDDNTVTMNFSFHNDEFDLYDDRSDCGGNRWWFNFYRNKSEACIR
ncbi:hypothetical protein SIN8267_02183 [Sinobacterium norvegicum]|uniref:Right handed beta helix domain-containing protein n=1 Tax=Sinobacterium norvegicum TaxID=1641715 RepID=A0ABN8EI33_9GAMM|nr:right-handed parallel beta-helix repeat-containing protein [Sinobacterium norvegicum]CAH0992068.1 hypothetical protein SIN8267_02183 [Sinobacterium norvegicum]